EANVKDLSQIYDAIYRDHEEGVEYTLTDEALKAYDSFDEKTCQEINSQWDAGEIASYDGEIGKDRSEAHCYIVCYIYIYAKSTVCKLWTSFK
ncbi:Hypothetical predicted protein, partial [Paramuricea clavata]